jgi:hypothetical protein
VLRKLVSSRLVVIIYIVVGLILAGSHHYFDHLGGAKPVLSAALAVVLWPLILLGVSLHIK